MKALKGVGSSFRSALNPEAGRVHTGQAEPVLVSGDWFHRLYFQSKWGNPCEDWRDWVC